MGIKFTQTQAAQMQVAISAMISMMANAAVVPDAQGTSPTADPWVAIAGMIQLQGPIPHADGPNGPTLRAYVGPQDEPTASCANGVFVKDYWVTNRIGAAKGALQNDYSQVMMITSMMGLKEPFHTKVVTQRDTTDPKQDCWTATKQAGDIGWADGAHYQPQEPANAANYPAWVAAGCPSKAMDGRRLDGFGNIWVVTPGLPTWDDARPR